MLIKQFYLSPNIIRLIKSRRMSWTRYLAPMSKQELHKKIWSGKILRVTDH